MLEAQANTRKSTRATFQSKKQFAKSCNASRSAGSSRKLLRIWSRNIRQLIHRVVHWNHLPENLFHSISLSTDFASGAIQSLANPSYCVDTLSHGEKENIGLYYCAADILKPQSTQFFALSWQRDIRIKHGESCWDVSEAGKAPIALFGCHGMQGNQLFRYDRELKHVIHSHTSRCLEANFDDRSVSVNTCRRDNVNQKWKFGFVNETALDDWVNAGSRLIT